MATLTELLRYRDDLVEARYSGLRSTRDSNGEEVVFKSDAEMARAIAALDAEISNRRHRATRTITFSTSKGL